MYVSDTTRRERFYISSRGYRQPNIAFVVNSDNGREREMVIDKKMMREEEAVFHGHFVEFIRTMEYKRQLDICAKLVECVVNGNEIVCYYNRSVSILHAYEISFIKRIEKEREGSHMTQLEKEELIELSNTSAAVKCNCRKVGKSIILYQDVIKENENIRAHAFKEMINNISCLRKWMKVLLHQIRMCSPYCNLYDSVDSVLVEKEERKEK